MAKIKATLLVGTLAAAGVGTYAYLSADDDTAGTRHLTNQVWIERMPDNRADMISHVVLLDKDGEQFGVLGRSSTWRHVLELFGWRLENDRLKLFFPQERVRGEVKVRTWRCEGEAPEPFELCLEFSNKGRSVQFYSRRDWVIKDADSLQELAVEVPELKTVFESGDVAAFEFDEDAAAEYSDGPLPL